MSSEYSYDYYSDEEEEDYSESESRPRRRKKDKEKERKKERPRRREREREKRRGRKEKKHHKKERERKRGHRERERKRRRSRSKSGGNLGYGASRRAAPPAPAGSPSPPPPRRRAAVERRRSPSGSPPGATLRGRSSPRPARAASPPPAVSAGKKRSRSPSGSCSCSRSQGARGRSGPRPRMAPPDEGRVLSIAEACEAAGRGMTTGQTANDDDVKVLGPDERPAEVDPYEKFDDVKAFPREIREELKKAGFPAPSQIQAWTWPLGVKGKDVIGIAATGSGKTLAFLLPAFAEMYDRNIRPEREGPGLLVMSPTRELAQQTEQEASRFGRCLGFRTVAMYGGAPKGQQMSKYRGGCHTIVACPGRLNDFLEGGQVRLDGIAKLVLDEADRMLDMGFEPQIRKILAKIPRRRHTLFFTATWPREVRQLASEILSKPYKVMIGNRDELKGNQDVTQEIRVVDGGIKNREIENLLREAGLTRRDSRGKALVFCNTKRMCDQLANTLHRGGLPCNAIHGDKDQMARDDALNGLKTGRVKVLVATDVAARGLDIKGVGLVVNYDPANNTEDYVHRIGRTGRAGAKGYAVTFLTHADGHKARGIVEVMERTGQNISEEVRQLAGAGGFGGDRGGRHRGPRGGGGGHRGGGGGGHRGGGGGGDRGANMVPLGGGRGRSRSHSL